MPFFENWKISLFTVLIMNSVFSTRTIIENPTQYLAIRARNNPENPKNWLILARNSKKKLAKFAYEEFTRTSQINFRAEIGSPKNIPTILDISEKFYIEERFELSESWARFALDIIDDPKLRKNLMQKICISPEICKKRFSEIDDLFFEPKLQDDPDLTVFYTKILSESLQTHEAVSKVQNFLKITKDKNLNWILFDLYLRQRDFAAAMGPLLALVKSNPKDLRARTFRLALEIIFHAENAEMITLFDLG